MTRHLQVSSSGVQGGGKRRADGMQLLLARWRLERRSAAERASAMAVAARGFRDGRRLRPQSAFRFLAINGIVLRVIVPEKHIVLA